VGYNAAEICSEDMYQAQNYNNLLYTQPDGLCTDRQQLLLCGFTFKVVEQPFLYDLLHEACLVEVKVTE